MLKPKTRWNVQTAMPAKVEHLINELQVPPLIAKLLVNRNIEEPSKARRFLFMEEQQVYDPFLFFDMEKAVKRIKLAIENEEAILIYGDYDADGVTSTTLMMKALQSLYANVHFYIPNRFSEGYGPNEAAFRKAAEQGFRLIITVDNGIAAVHEAAVAKELGIDLIITDHHEPGPELPDAFAIIHPKHPDGQYPFKELAGVGVAYKLAHALYGKEPEQFAELAAIGTIADLVPLNGENRLLVKKGLKKIKTTDCHGIKALCEVIGINIEEINEDTIGFMIGPRLNAPGRLDHAAPAVNLLMAASVEATMTLAENLDLMNKERQKIVQAIADEAFHMVESLGMEKQHVIVLGKEGWNPGVIGIVASKLVERYYRPTIILSYNRAEETAKGSARSIQGFDIFANLSKCRSILPHFGGHTMAAGMTLSIKDVDVLREQLNELAASQLQAEDYVPIVELDAKIDLEEIDLVSIQQLELLAPFGMQNPKPVFLIEQLHLDQIRKIGSNRNHLKLMLKQHDHVLDAVGFGMGEYADHLSPIAKASVIGELAVNEWNNIKKPQIFLKDIAVSEWQLFDVRGNKQWEKWMTNIPNEKRIFIVFRESTFEKLSLSTYENEVLHVADESIATSFDPAETNLIFCDLPASKDLLEKLIIGGTPSRIYAHFYHDKHHFFSTMPTREHFKWFYGFLAKRESFNLKRYASELANFRGWSLETIEFMSEVFFELEFVTMEDGVISLRSVQGKRDLSESQLYQQKQSQFTLENELLYSTCHELKHWFDKKTQWSVKHEEEVEVWI